MTCTFKSLTLAAMTATTLALSATGANAFYAELFRLADAGFDICEDVTIHITNHDDESVLLVDLDYYDHGNDLWRSEPTRNQTIEAGETLTITRNLENVEDTEIRIGAIVRDPDAEIDIWADRGRWRGESDDFICRHNSEVSVAVWRP